MTAHVPIRNTSDISRMEALRAEADAADDAHWEELVSGRHAAERRRGFRKAVSLIDDASEILRRTSAIVDRLCPLPPMPPLSTRWNCVRPAMPEEWAAHTHACRERSRLHREIKPRIEAKVRGS